MRLVCWIVVGCQCLALACGTCVCVCARIECGFVVRSEPDSTSAQNSVWTLRSDVSTHHHGSSSSNDPWSSDTWSNDTLWFVCTSLNDWMAMARVLCAAHRLCDALVIVVADCWHKVDVHTCVQWVVVVQFYFSITIHSYVCCVWGLCKCSALSVIYTNQLLQENDWRYRIALWQLAESDALHTDTLFTAAVFLCLLLLLLFC